MPLRQAVQYLADIVPVLPGLFELEPQARPTGLQECAVELSADSADLESCTRQLLSRLNEGAAFRVVSLSMPTPQEVSEFGRIEARAYLATPEFVPDHTEKWLTPERFVFPDKFSLRGDLPEIELVDVAVSGDAGSAWPVTFSAMPLMHGTWHDEFIGVGLMVPCPYTLNKGGKLDADANGLFVETSGTRVAKTVLWLDHWTPIHAPGGSTRCGTLCTMDSSELDAGAQRLGAKLAWRVDVVTWTPQNGIGDLVRTRKSTFFFD
ncbi:hypothetical protein LB543_21505 [Mesorhizobium sp. ESP7-2]|uniref:hypothetical protein n=1 Tax=Mesorhizobium sp. ESP7-2 TaxID=2876622 RepID=UPI001CCA303C|nr:hypothetical protein [Mesorhizobium sp. ESP7-2]MBZ9709305.1 hypothetical protein [Mesorhizobium sp. ESP7-2]